MIIVFVFSVFDDVLVLLSANANGTSRHARLVAGATRDPWKNFGEKITVTMHALHLQLQSQPCR